MPYHGPKRISPRLQGYDYSQNGTYFITICTYKRMHSFGAIADRSVQLSPSGEITAACWHAIPCHYPRVNLDAFVVMQNHIHGIIMLSGGGAALGTIIGSYKAAVTRQAHQNLLNAPQYIWQSRYHDHVILTDHALERIRAYIEYNPIRWSEDRLSG